MWLGPPENGGRVPSAVGVLAGGGGRPRKAGVQPADIGLDLLQVHHQQLQSTHQLLQVWLFPQGLGCAGRQRLRDGRRDAV